jgi:hypothetical protein
MTGLRSRRAGIDPVAAKARPLYARVLGLQYVQPSNLRCFLFLEGAVALGVLLALAELGTWWMPVILPLSIAIMVKVNDMIAGATARSGVGSRRRAVGTGLAPVAAGRADLSAAVGRAGERSSRISGRASVPGDGRRGPARAEQQAPADLDPFAARRRQAASRRYE